MMDILSIIAGGLVGAVVTLVIQLYWQSKQTTRQLKLDCLRRVAAHRSGPATKEFAAALNEIFVTFNKSTEVVRRMETFQGTINQTGGHSNDELMALVKSMMDDLALKHDRISDTFLLSRINGV